MSSLWDFKDVENLMFSVANALYLVKEVTQSKDAVAYLSGLGITQGDLARLGGQLEGFLGHLT